MKALESFEQAVYAERFDAATASLHDILANFERDGGDPAASARDWFHWRLAGAIAALLVNRRYRPTHEAYCLLCASQPALAAVFACTPFANPDHVISLLADVRDPGNLRFADETVLMKCLLCYTLDSDYRLDLDQIAAQRPELAAPLLLAQLSCQMFSRARVLERVNELVVRDWPFLEQVTPSLPTVLTLSGASMHCSYATAPGRHRVKRDLNALARNWMRARGLDPDRRPVTAPTTRARPRLVIPLEILTAIHAMHRCFIRSISKLRDEFEVIAVAPGHCVDAATAAVFDQVITFEAGEAITDPRDLVAEIEALAPDVVYYPSLGMANYTLLLAGLRLAPVQCFTLGHPATSHNDAIDYVLVQQQDFTTTAVYSERVVLTGNDTSPTIDRVREIVPRPRVRDNRGDLRIAVTSKHMKINHVFLKCCRTIAERTRRRLAFHFFPGTTGYLYEFVAAEIRRMLPDSQVWPTTGFEDYIRRLDRCDLRLGTFPFGGANTNMDCFGLGIPFVVMQGDEPHAQSDCAQLRQAGLPEWLMARDVDAYIAAALRLIEDDDERATLSRAMLALDDHPFFHPRGDGELIFDRTLSWLYHNHERIQQTDRRLWTLADQGLA